MTVPDTRTTLEAAREALAVLREIIGNQPLARRNQLDAGWKAADDAKKALAVLADALACLGDGTPGNPDAVGDFARAVQGVLYTPGFSDSQIVNQITEIVDGYLAGDPEAVPVVSSVPQDEETLRLLDALRGCIHPNMVGRASELLDRLAALAASDPPDTPDEGCVDAKFSSRVCSRGTVGCEQRHGAVPVSGSHTLREALRSYHGVRIGVPGEPRRVYVYDADMVDAALAAGVGGGEPARETSE